MESTRRKGGLAAYRADRFFDEYNRKNAPVPDSDEDEFACSFSSDEESDERNEVNKLTKEE